MQTGAQLQLSVISLMIPSCVSSCWKTSYFLSVGTLIEFLEAILICISF